MRPLTATLLLLALAAPAAAQPAGRTVVFVANGSGGSTTVSESLRDIAARSGDPFAVQDVPWSRYGTALADHADVAGQAAAATNLAKAVLCLRRDCPGCRIVLVGHSTGTHVLLLAAAQLPPASVDRIVLLSSSVACTHDVRPALRASCGGVDNFYSTEDNLLILAEASVGDPSGQLVPLAGRVGFCVPPVPGLRQYGWVDGVPGYGGHYVWARPVNLRRTVVPLLLTDAR